MYSAFTLLSKANTWSSANMNYEIKGIVEPVQLSILIQSTNLTLKIV